MNSSSLIFESWVGGTSQLCLEQERDGVAGPRTITVYEFCLNLLVGNHRSFGTCFMRDDTGNRWTTGKRQGLKGAGNLNLKMDTYYTYTTFGEAASEHE